MSPLECLARLAAMVPPPRYPLLRLHGVLAPRHAWRARVVPRPPESHARCMKAASEAKPASVAGASRPAELALSANERQPPRPSTRTQAGTGEAALLPPANVVETSELVATGAAVQAAPNILSIAHWQRLLGGELYAPLSRVGHTNPAAIARLLDGV